MVIKKYLVTNMNEAMRRIRQDLGVEAIIISERKVRQAGIKGLFGKVKITGVGLGCQLIALALGAKTDKLAFGHRGSNHPVKDISNGKVYITTQTQGFTVSNLTKEMEITYRNINDSTAAGYKSESLNIEAVQFMPDRDSEFIYDGFMK